jgi:acyl carrier protein
MNIETIKEEIKNYIKETIIQGDSVELLDATPLISGGIVDSISTLKMVDFLEVKFGIEFQPHEVDRENLDTIDLIATFVLSKK